MKTTIINIENLPARLHLGKQGENRACEVVFDCTSYASTFGAGTAQIVHTSSDGTTYAVDIDQQGSAVHWIVTSADTANAGPGHMELRWYVNDAIAKSVIVHTMVTRSITQGLQPPPDKFQSWLDQLTDLGAQTARNAEGADQAARDAERALTELKTGIASGDFRGDVGPAGPQGERGEKGDTYTLTDNDKHEIADAAADELRPDVTQLKEDLSALDVKTDDTQRSLDYLWKVNKGQTWDIESVECEGHAQLPSGGEYGNVDEVRGKTEQDGTNGYQLISVIPTSGLVQSAVEFTWNGTEVNVDIKSPLNNNVYSSVNDNIIDAISLKNKGFYLPQGTYTFSCDGLIKETTAQLLTTNGETYTSSVFGGVTTTTKSKTITTTEPLWVFPRLFVQANTQAQKLTIKFMLEEGSIAHDWEPFTNGASPNPEYPQGIKSVESIHILHTDADGETLAERTITPPRPLNKIGEYADVCDVVNGVWEYASKEITEEDFAHSVEREPEYFLLAEQQTEPISESDLTFLRNLTLNEGENLFITDNHGRDVSYLMSDFINLGKVVG